MFPLLAVVLTLPEETTRTTHRNAVGHDIRAEIVRDTIVAKQAG